MPGEICGKNSEEDPCPLTGGKYPWPVRRPNGQAVGKMDMFCKLVLDKLWQRYMDSYSAKNKNRKNFIDDVKSQADKKDCVLQGVAVYIQKKATSC